MIFSPLRVSCLTILALLSTYGILVLLLTLRLWGAPEQDTTSGALICWDEVASGARNSWSVNSVGGACLGAGWQVQIEQAPGVNGFTAGASVSCAAGVVAVTHTTLDTRGNLWPRLSIMSVTGHVIADGDLAGQVNSPHYAAEWTALHALASPWIIVGQNIWNASTDGPADISILAMYSAQDAEIGDIYDLVAEPLLVDHILALGGSGDVTIFLACGDVQCALICLDADFSQGERSPRLVQRWLTQTSEVPALTDHVSISCMEHVVLVSWRAGMRGCQLAFGAAAGAPLWDTCHDANASVPLSASAVVSLPTWAAVTLVAMQNSTTNGTMVALQARSLRDGSMLWRTLPIMEAAPAQPNPYFLSVGTGVAVICRSLRETALLPQEGEFISAGVSMDTANVLWGDMHTPHGGFIGCAAQPVASADIAIFPLIRSHDFVPYPARALGAALTTDVYLTAREVRSGRTTATRVLQRVNLPDPATLADRGQLLSGLAMVMPDQSSALVVAQQQQQDTSQLIAQSLDCSTDDLDAEILNLSGAFMLLVFFASVFVARLVVGAAWACCFWVRDFRGVKTAVLSSPPMYKEIRALPVRKLLQYMCMDRYMQHTHRSDSGNDFGDTTVYRPMLAGDLRTFSDADSSDGPSDLESSASHPDLASQAAAAFRSRTSSQAGMDELWQQEADKLRLHAHQSLASVGSPKLGGTPGGSMAIGAPSSAWLASLPRVKPRRTRQELLAERARDCAARCVAGTASAARAPFRWVAERSVGCRTQAWEAGQYGQAGYPWLWLHAWHVVLGVVIVAAAMGGVGTEVEQFSSMLSDPAHFYNTYLAAAWDPASAAKVKCAIPSVAACLCAGERPTSQTCPDRPGYWPDPIEDCNKPCNELLPVMGVCSAASFQYTCSCAPIPAMHINSSTPVTDDLVNALASCSDRYVTIWNSLKLVAIIYVAVVLSVQLIIVWNRCLPVSSLCGRLVKRHDSLLAAMLRGQAQVASVMWPSYAALGLLGGGLLALVCVLLNSGELCTEAASPLSPEATTNTAALRPTSSLLLSHLPGCALNALWYNEAKEAAVLKAAWSATVSILIVVLVSVLDCAAMGCHLLVYGKNLQALAKAKYDEQQRVRDERSILPGARVSEKVTAPFSQLSIRTTYVWPGQMFRWRACCSNALSDAEIEASFSGQGSALLRMPSDEAGSAAQPRNVGVLFSMPTLGRRAYIGGVLQWGVPMADAGR